jgi:glutathione S-transferase
MSDLGEMIYFPVMAKGLQLALCAEMSGLKWSGYLTEETGPKSWDELKPSGIAPFGQMPLLKTPEGLVIGQACAIANYIAKKAGAILEGASDKDFALSQMCMSEGEDIYSMLGKCELAMWKTIEQRNSKLEEAKALFAEKPLEEGDGLARHLANLENLCRSDVNDDGKHSDCRFTSVSATLSPLRA